MKSVRASLVIFLLSVTNVRPVSLSQVMKNVRKKKKKKTLWKSHIYMKALGVSPENDVLLFVGVFYTFFLVTQMNHLLNCNSFGVIREIMKRIDHLSLSLFPPLQFLHIRL